MMFYGIIIAILSLVILAGIVYIIYTKYKVNKKEIKSKTLTDSLTTELLNKKKPLIILGKLVKYKESELDILLSNPDILNLLIRMFEYKVAIKTDTIRSLTETERKVGHLDCLHEQRLFFLKLQAKLDKKEKKDGQNLV